MKSKKIQITIAILFGALCLVLFWNSVEDWSEVWAAMKQAKWRYLIVAVMVQYLSMLIRAMRWQSFLGDPKVPLIRLYLITNIGFMSNGVLPARMGELIRPFLVWRYTQHAFPTAVATIVVERVFDLLGLLLILALVLWIAPFPVMESGPDVELKNDVPTSEIEEQIDLPSDPLEWVQGVALMGIVLFLVLFSFISLMTYAPIWSLRVATKILSPLPTKISKPLLQAVVSFEKGASTFRRPSSLFYCLFLTLFLWVSMAFGELVVLWALGITKVSMGGALFLMIGLCFAVMFPQLPGYIGTFQFATWIILHRTFFVESNVAGAAAWVLWLSQVPPVILLGFICLVIMGVSFKEISHVREHLPREIQEELEEDEKPPL